MKSNLLILFLSIVSLTYSQTGNKAAQTNFKKHSIGIDVGKQSGNTNLHITYRQFNEESKWNLLLYFNVGGTNDTYFETGNKLLLNTGDSLTPIIGLDRQTSSYSNYQKLGFGVERELNIWKLKLIGGVNGMIGHKSTYMNRSVYEMSRNETIVNGISYYEYSIFDQNNEFLGDLNTLSMQRNFVTYGLAFRLGFKVDLSKRLYLTAFTGINVEGVSLVSESQTYKTEEYKEHLPTYNGINIGEFNNFSNVGIHYRF